MPHIKLNHTDKTLDLILVIQEFPLSLQQSKEIIIPLFFLFFQSNFMSKSSENHKIGDKVSKIYFASTR